MYPVIVDYDRRRVPPPVDWKAIPDEECRNALLYEIKCKVEKIALDHNGHHLDESFELACPGVPGKFCFEVKIRSVCADTENGIKVLAKYKYADVKLGQWYFRATIVEEPTLCK